MLTVILDDDPTGTQSASDVTVLLDWDERELVRVLRSEGSVYLQTNSRAISAAEAAALAERIRAQIAAAESELGEKILVVLRGDSTLRGHVFVESDVFAEESAPILFVPAFPQGGRTTVGSVHRVVIAGVNTPVGQTEFAQDPVFGYRNSNLVAFVKEKGDRMAVPVPLDELRRTNGLAVSAALLSAGPHEFVVPDVETDDDIRLIHAGLLDAVALGLDVVVRSGATLAALCAGRLSTAYLDRPLVAPPGAILVVCGSHTNGATAQLEAVTARFGWEPIVIPTAGAYDNPGGAARTAVEQARLQLAEHGIAIVCSERVRHDADNTLRHGELVMEALITAVRALATSAAVVISKGGITSAEVARTGLSAARAHVRGQVLAGVSVWDLPPSGFATVQIVVPGNVGDANTIVDVITALPNCRV
jgi:uncharacterized protein YgbK (DUF1537 family)